MSFDLLHGAESEDQPGILPTAERINQPNDSTAATVDVMT